MGIRRPPRIALTPGEPGGIGPDLCTRLASESHPAELVAVADPALLAESASRLGRHLELSRFDARARSSAQRAGTLKVLPIVRRRRSVPGRLDPLNAHYVLETLTAACDGCLSRAFDALVTGPVHKGVINDAGRPFSGHTEFLAERCHCFPVMMLATAELRVALASTHLPLAKVSTYLTPTRLERVTRILHGDLRDKFGIPHPRILVCGLNPHAGEGGHLGSEEIEVIEPVLNRLRQERMDLVGPIPADTAFVPDKLAHTDAVLAMYHDQGLPVLKHLGFGRAVNVTLGLPIIRTSVDHGTALDLAGTGQGDSDSLEAALATAVDMVARSAA